MTRRIAMRAARPSRKAARRRRGEGKRLSSRGYILVEAAVAMAVLSIGMLGIHGAMRETGITGAQARDFTQARFLLERLIVETELQPMLVEGTETGEFEGALSRFRWRRTISKVTAPPPPELLVKPPWLGRRPGAPSGPPRRFGAMRSPYLGKISATVRWTRNGRPFERTVETLFSPEKLYVPPEYRS